VAQPVFRHGVPRFKMRRVERIVEQFGKFVSSRMKKLVAAGAIDIDKDLEATADSLLNLRKRLVKAVKVGMLDRQDQEEVIGALAALIYWSRLDENRKFEIEQSDLRG